ncbi:hypothetical protein H7R52_01875 [Weissella confusa]|uniref:Uncharacterized protein n=1 Tax=Weissella confusa TaxID=1583 RepID=A0A923NCY5_WEICO|nr:hypothetical protein [Weissella confusa]
MIKRFFSSEGGVIDWSIIFVVMMLVPVMISESPLDNVAVGAGKLLEHMHGVQGK